MGHAIKKAWCWVGSAYFIQGAAYAVFALLTTLFYQQAGYANDDVTFYASLLFLPWVLKPVWSTLLERFESRRSLLTCQFVQIVLYILLATAMFLHGSFWLGVTLLAFFIMGVLMATYDVFCDGFYMHVLSVGAQASFVGYRTMWYQIGRIAVQGGLVVWLGFLLHHHATQTAWQMIFLSLAVYGAVFLFLHYFLLPTASNVLQQSTQPSVEAQRQRAAQDDAAGLRPTGDSATLSRKETSAVRHILQEFFALPRIVWFLVFAFVYNLPEAQLQRVLPLFLLDQHGMQLSVSSIGWILGVLGVVSMIAGVLLSGYWVSRDGCRKHVLGVTLYAALGNLGYVWLSMSSAPVSYWVVVLYVMVAQFLFGLSNGVYMTALLRKVCHCRYKMSCYAYLTALMSASFAAFGAMSGALQHALGYTSFFAWVVLSGLLLVLFVRVWLWVDDTA